MGHFVEFDHREVSKDLDITAWNSYPLGNLQNMQIIARYIYNNLNNKNMNEYNRNIQLNKYCNCNSIKKYIPDTIVLFICP